MSRRPPYAVAIAALRTLVFVVTATLAFVAAAILFAPILLFPPQRMRWVLTLWARVGLLLLRLIVGQRMEVLGGENVPRGPALIAAKHQAAWETVALLPLLPRATVVLKRELLRLPLFGHYARFFRMVAVDRAAGPSALKQVATDAAERVATGAQVLIFPEGTRRALDAPPDYKPGAIFLYERLAVPMVPVALNSGLLWPRQSFVRYPGTVTVSFLPPIPPGLSRTEARTRLIAAIENETARLVALARGV